jgi:hypothetical protein
MAMTKREAIEWARSYSDDDVLDEDELDQAFRAIYGRNPDRYDRETGLWSLIWAAIPSKSRRKRNPAIKLPSKFTPAEVRVNEQGKVQIRINPAKLGSGGRFAKCVESVTARGGARDPRAVCAAVGRKKYGAKKFAAMARAGRKRTTRHNPATVSMRKYKWGRLYLKADWAQSSSPILYATDRPEDFDSTPFQVATFAHNRTRAFSGVNQWLKEQWG